MADKPDEGREARKATLLRLDPKVHDALQRWARDELRSLNAQAEFILRRALQRAGRLGRDADADDAGAGRANDRD